MLRLLVTSDFWEKQIEIAPKISKNSSNSNFFFFSHNTCGCCSVAKSCPTLCDPMDYSTLGFPKEIVSFTASQSFLKFMSTESVILFNHVILYALFSFCLLSFPVSGSFPVSWLITSRGQSIGASASFFSMNIQVWFP